MSQYQIAVVVGSLRSESFNHKLASGLAKLAPTDFVLNDTSIGDLPMYNQDDDASPSAAVTSLKTSIEAADALLFVTPEYNRSVPGVLKNAIDHASRPYGQSVWGGRPAGVIGVSIGSLGTSMAQQHLRNILAYLDVPVLGQPEAFIQFKEDMFNADGSFGDNIKPFLQSWMNRYEDWVRTNAMTRD